jgi:hypothetical protein
MLVFVNFLFQSALMSQSRQLAAIMFTEIEGYTAIMQQNEQQALSLRQALVVIYWFKYFN